MSIEEGKVYRRKKSCRHDEAVWDGNGDWPGLKCKDCGEAIPELNVRFYEPLNTV